MGELYLSSSLSVRMDLVGNLAYVASGHEGLVIVDTTDSYNPAHVGTFGGVESYARSVDISGSFAYITDYHHGLKIVNISIPENPVIAADLPLPDMTREVRVFGNYAFVTNRPHLGTAGRPAIRIVDVTTPSEPVVRGIFEFNAIASIPCLDDTEQYLFVPTLGDGVYVLDVTDKDAPSFETRYDFLPYVSKVDIRGNYLYLDDREQERIVVYNISDIHNPSEISSSPMSRHRNVDGFEIAGGLWIVNSWLDAIMIFDVSNVNNPHEIGVFDETKGLVYVLDVEDDNALVVTTKGTTDRLSSLDISALPEIGEEATIDTPYGIYEVDVVGGYAFVATWNRGLVVYDVSDPANPVEAGACEEFQNARSVDVVGNYAYLACANNGLMIVDISTPTSPTFVSSWDTPGYAFHAVISGDYAYVSDLYWWSGLRIVDISDPLNPWEVGSLEFEPNRVRQIEISGNHVFLVHDRKTLRVVDVSDPANPLLVEGAERETYYPFYMATSGHLLIISDWLYGVRVMDVSDPTNPVEVAVLREFFVPEQIVVKENHIYILNRDSGMFVVEYR
jgi:hypothetical protein